MAACTTPACALTSPQIGWKTQFSEDFHDVSGTISVFDEDTLQFNDFTFDGGGLSIYFYLGASDSPASYSAGLSIGDELFGTVYDGMQEDFFVDLPFDQTLEGWNAISVWCVTVGVSFGSGAFGLPGDFDTDFDADGDDYLHWQRGESPDPYSDVDLADWQANFGTTVPVAPALAVVPEPSSAGLLLLALFGYYFQTARTRQAYPQVCA